MRSHKPIMSFTSCSISSTVHALVADFYQQFAQCQLFGGVHAGRRFVQRQQLRLGGQRARDFQAALVAVG